MLLVRAAWMEAALHEFIVIIYLFLCAAKLPNCKVCRRRRRCLTGGIQNGCSLFVENDRAGKTCERQRHSGNAIRRPASQGGGLAVDGFLEMWRKTSKRSEQLLLAVWPRYRSGRTVRPVSDLYRPADTDECVSVLVFVYHKSFVDVCLNVCHIECLPNDTIRTRAITRTAQFVAGTIEHSVFIGWER